MLGIVVLNFNGLELLKKYLPNIVKHSANANIYVIDNNSNDGSQSYILNSFSSVKLIKNEKNYGYAEGYNKGLRFVNDEILCLINNDVLVLSIKVKGTGDYLPEYAGNLDIINCAAIEISKNLL